MPPPLPRLATSMLIDGALIARSDGDRSVRRIVDPARDRPLGAAPEATPAEVDAAVAGAARAFRDGTWRRRTPEQRGEVLRQIADRLRAAAADLALVESCNVGKPVDQARGDVQQAIDLFDYYARVIVDQPGEVIQDDDDQMTVVLREPVGVVAVIVPWNYPLAIAATAVAPALATGCSVVLKPSELTPFSALGLAEAAAGLLPPGVLNVVCGEGPTVGDALVSHPGVDQVAFTGGTATGAAIMAKASRSLKRLGLELGGKSPTIVLDDAPFDASVAAALQRIATNQGENCGAGSRLLVARPLYDDFVAALVAAAARLRTGDPQEVGTDLGPMISAAHRERVRGHVAVARQEARAVFTGSVPSDAPLANGFFEPLSIWEAGPDTRLWHDEVFGPVLALTAFGSESEAVALANDSSFGLMASIWCGDRGRGFRVARALRAGVIRINDASPPLHGPWGGFKQSGLGGRGQGRYGLHACTELKQISLDLT